MRTIHTLQREGFTVPAAPSAEQDRDRGSTEDLFREARRRERRRRLIVLALLGAMALAGGLLASLGGAPPRQPGVATPASDGGSSVALTLRFTLRGNGFGAVRFGQAESVVIVDLDKMLGGPEAQSLQPQPDCTIDSYVQWSRMAAYFDHGRFVGYATATLQPGTGSEQVIPNATTAAGLRIGDSLAEAERIYGKSLRTSSAQGGSWFAATSTGTLAGYLTAEIGHPQPPVPRIADITAGAVGCPAASP